MWYAKDLARFEREKEAVVELASRVSWLTLRRCYIDVDGDLDLCWDADITVADRTFEVTLRYPTIFPSTPTRVVPRDPSARWSRHQWGRGGELCTEIGADNWHPDITGAAMLESAHRLLEIEYGSGSEPVVAPSRHEFTEGQNLRSSVFRFFPTWPLLTSLLSLPEQCPHSASVLGLYSTGAAVFLIRELHKTDGTDWSDPEIPSGLDGEAYKRKATVVRVAAEGELPRTDSRENFLIDVAKHGVVDPPDSSLVILVRGYGIHAYLMLSSDSVHEVTVVLPAETAARNPTSHEVLASRSVGLVGCGSLGSKVAVSLARAGVRKFVLVDDDIIREGNLVRNDLDWRDLGLHKVHALARRLQLVGPGVDVERKAVRLGGYESGRQTEAVLKALSGCDLIFDATSDGMAFNYLSSASTTAQKPLVWAEVLAGGIGGIVARYRPTIEPDPQTIRAAIAHWFEGKGFPPPAKAEEYGLPTEGRTLIADDADVTAISGHAARLAIDTLLPRQPSGFPYSAYVIGLSSVGFAAPFDTHPIDLASLPRPAAAPNLPEEQKAAIAAQVIELMSSSLNEAEDKA